MSRPWIAILHPVHQHDLSKVKAQVQRDVLAVSIPRLTTCPLLPGWPGLQYRFVRRHACSIPTKLFVEHLCGSYAMQLG